MKVWPSIIFYIMVQVCTKKVIMLFIYSWGQMQLEKVTEIFIFAADRKNIKLFLKAFSPFQINLVFRFLFRAVCFFSPKISPDLPFMPDWHQVGIREDSQPLNVLGTVWSFSGHPADVCFTLVSVFIWVFVFISSPKEVNLAIVT